MREKIKTRLPSFIRENFQGNILSPHYERNPNKVRAIELETFDLETVRGIQRKKNR